MIKFTRKESLVVECLREGLKNKEISERLQIQPTTVKFHLTNIYWKYGVNSRSQFLVKYFHRVSTSNILWFKRVS